jgi:hypothetical protein
MSKSTTQNVVQTTSNIGAAQQPYYNMAMQGAASLLTTPMARYDRDRLEGFTGQQKKLQGEIAGLQAPRQFGDASTLATAAGLGSLQAGQYTPGQFGFQQVTSPQVQAATMQAAQSGYSPDLTTFQMQAPDQFGQQQAGQYMSPYIQNVMDIQKREAITDAKKGQIVQDLGAARQGTYGGSRQLLAGLERERGLGQQLGDIQARGLQSAYENAQQQFERDRAASMDAQRQNLASQISTQQLKTTTDLEVAMANLSNDQQSRVQNLAAENQMRGMNAENALRSALANQQAGMEMQRMAEQSRQFGSQQGLAGLAQAGQMGQTLANIGSAQQQADAQRLGLQTSTAAQEQAFNQQMRDLDYADFMREADNPYTQLQRYMSLMSGVPQATTSTRTESAPSPSIGSQLLSSGLGAASIYNTANRAGVI